MNLFNAVLYLHIACVVVSVSLFVLRYWWSWSGNRLLDQRWVRIAPHCSDTLLFLSGAGLMAITHYLPFTEEGTWLTEKAVWRYHLYRIGIYRAGPSSPAQSAEPVCRLSAGPGGVVYHYSTRHHKNTVTGVRHEVVS
ncbi:protein sirB2 [Klebsiella michiganensis]|uniref:Protein sirB2 n=1 Tax=Klebsiella michiganensis TaxID=1134687 RepID=A0A7H4PKU5_9ENTR|nr:protein sirB2 [Klebsiella michiganensis]